MKANLKNPILESLILSKTKQKSYYKIINILIKRNENARGMTQTTFHSLTQQLVCFYDTEKKKFFPLSTYNTYCIVPQP